MAKLCTSAVMQYSLENGGLTSLYWLHNYSKAKNLQHELGNDCTMSVLAAIASYQIEKLQLLS